MKITLDMIKTDVDYVSLYNFEGNLSHELKRLGGEDFVTKYVPIANDLIIKTSRDSIDFINLCYLVGVLETLDSSLIFDDFIKLDGYIVDLRDFDPDIDDDLTQVNERLTFALPKMLNRGFIYSELDSAV